MMIPTIHLNGTSREALLEDYCEAADALRVAIGIVSAKLCPNGRDYYPQGPEAYGRACAEHLARIGRLESVLSELREIGEAL